MNFYFLSLKHRFYDLKRYLGFVGTEYSFKDAAYFSQCHVAFCCIDYMRDQIFIWILGSILESTYCGISLGFITVSLKILKPSYLPRLDLAIQHTDFRLCAFNILEFVHANDNPFT